MTKRSNFEMLNALRGVAAVLVLLFHLAPDFPALPFFGSAYLSVDLFFMMSGFVIAYAYEEKLRGGLGFRRFVEIRVIRLYPLYLLGLAIAAVPLAALWVHHGETWRLHDLARRLAWGVMLLPRPAANPVDWWTLDPPAWSLFYELALNFAYAALITVLSNRVLVAVASVSGAVLLWLCWQQGTANLSGTGLSALLLGFCRPGFSLPVGILLYRWWKSGRLPRWRVGAAWGFPLFLLPVALPAHGAAIGLLAPLGIILIFPAVVTLAVQNEMHDRWQRVGAWLGELSYPLYVLHFPIIAGVHLALPGRNPELVDALVIAIALFTAQLSTGLYDRPVRTVLSRWAALRRGQVEQAPAL